MDDISQVVKNYYAVIGQKDEDIFELYRDNRRLQKQLGEVLMGEEERETDRRTLKLLVATLQTELREKQVLIDAQQREGAAIRSAVWRAREILNMSSELDYPVEAVIGACINLYTECAELRARQEYLVGAETHLRLLVCRTLFWAEQHARDAVADACNGAYVTLARLLRCTKETMVEKQRLCESHRAAESAQSERMELMEKQAQLERSQQERVVEEWREQVTCVNRRLLLFQRCLHHERAEKELLVEAACSRLDLMVERGADVERLLALVFRCLVRHDKQLQEVRYEAAVLRGKLQKVRADFSRAKALLRRKRQSDQREQQLGLDCSGGSNTMTRDNGEKEKSDSVHDAFRALQVEHEAFKAEWRKCAEREREARRQAAARINTLKAERSACEIAVAACQERCATLVKALQRTRLEAKRHAKEVRHMQERRDAVRDEVNLYAERIKSLEEMNRVLGERNMAQLSCVESLQKELREKEEALNSAERAFCERIAFLEGRLHMEKEGFLGELKEWTLVLEEARKKLVVAESERDREAMLRGMLVEQHREEERMLKKVLAEEHQAAVVVLQGKIDVLELACGRSAAVIAELRELLHRAKTETSTA
ncbi:viral A-type inclusion protein [Trypanosoma rangeli]|uniref:Viral A-type inclusion protein n=1 Tax=Trypanosoma rangeli TaxID=5698 RepID=A0A3R7MKL4_TRYRA|nr:viral A-type inclusion protein [Trypanosoma rangeli]RNF07509.1 viral A-type inclusion protein [Trypanosoma rangeli]|eukprot:RNF07509.1 viral A-type inclusion protein [Trypanosoma rangeli]